VRQFLSRLGFEVAALQNALPGDDESSSGYLAGCLFEA
jgi:hypothetical protein